MKMKIKLCKNDKANSYRVTILLSFFFFAIILLGCQSNSWVSRTTYYPKGADRNSSQYQLFIEVHGARNYSYVDKTSKNVYLSIWKGQTKLLDRNYVCTAASLEWDVAWDNLDDLNVTFFDFFEGISIYDKDAITSQAKQIFSLRFTYDHQSSEFKEYPVSPAIIKRLKAKPTGSHNK